jgi:uncharacterized integral membrane protein
MKSNPISRASKKNHYASRDLGENSEYNTSMIISLIIGLLLGAVTVVFALQNTASVSVVFLSWTFNGSLALILILAMGVGVVLTILLSLPGMINKNFKISSLKKQHNITKEELENKTIEVETEKAKLSANNAYLDDLEKNPKIHN